LVLAAGGTAEVSATVAGCCRKAATILIGSHVLAGKVVELDVILISVDASAAANGMQPQFDMGGESEALRSRPVFLWQ